MSNYPLLIDVFEGSGLLDLPKLKENNIQYVMVRLGCYSRLGGIMGNRKDDLFDKQWALLNTDSWFKKIVYIPYNPWWSWQNNLKFLLDNIPSDCGGVELDVENVRTFNYSPKQYAAEFAEYLKHIPSNIQKIIYTGEAFLPYLDAWPKGDYSFAQYPYALRPSDSVNWTWDQLREKLGHYNGPYNANKCPDKLKAWQFTGDKVILPGSDKGMDVYAWLGNQEELDILFAPKGTVINPPPPITNPSRYTGNVLGTVSLGLNVRDKPVSGLVIDKLQHDSYFEADTLENGWFHLTLPNNDGYISSIWTKYIDNDKITPPTTKNLGLYYVIPHYRTGTNGPAISPCSRNTKLFDNASQLDYVTWSGYLKEINKYDNSGKENFRLDWIADPNSGPTKGVNENGKYRWIGLSYPGNVIQVLDIVDGQDGKKWAKIKSVSNNIIPNSTKINYIKTPYLVHQCFGWNSKNELFPLVGNKGGCVVPVVGETDWYIPMSELRSIKTLQNMNIRSSSNTSATIVGSKPKGSEIYISELNDRNKLSDDLWGKLSDNSGWIAIKVNNVRYTDWQFI